MQVFIKPIDIIVEVKRMPYVIRHEPGRGFAPRGFIVETMEGEIYEVSGIEDMIFIFESMEEMNQEREQLQNYRDRSTAYLETYARFKKEFKMEPDEFMRVMPFETFK